jgi:hypothetical protein
MDTSEYCQKLGKLVANLHSLEFALRAFLLKYFEGQEPQTDISTLLAGDEVPSNSFTNHESLGQLINKFNDVIQSYPYCCIDKTVVEIRDMIAHGRVSGKNPEPPYQLIKFGRPNKRGMIPVEHVVITDSRWLSTSTNLVLGQIQKITKASNQLGQNILSYG